MQNDDWKTVPSYHLDQFSKQSATRQSLEFDSEGLNTNIYMIDAEQHQVSDLPDLVKIGQELEYDLRKRKQDGFTTVGGGIHEVNPINGSNIMYTNNTYSIIIAQPHCLQQFYKLQSFKQLLNNVSFFTSSILDQPKDLYKSMVKHLGIDMRWIDAQ